MIGIVRVVATPFGKRPFRVHIDPADDGAEVVNGVADRVRRELLRNMSLADLLKPSRQGACPDRLRSFDIETRFEPKSAAGTDREIQLAFTVDP